MKRVLILGSNGLLGSHLYRVGKERGFETIGLSKTRSNTVDITGDATEAEWLKTQIERAACDVLINAVKFKGTTDDCEIRRQDCWNTNYSVPSSLASIQERLGFQLVHISTDWIFEGKRGTIYNETSIPYPQNFYALSKLAAEIAVTSQAQSFLILRTTGLFGLEQPPRNFLARLLEALQTGNTFPAAGDQYSQPISALELATLTYELLEKGIHNRILMATGPDYVSRYQFARTAASALGLRSQRIKKVTSDRRKIRIPRYLRTDINPTEEILGHKIKHLVEMIRELNATN
jgi:dTDP-4-dehydrorhamnose reductase